MSFNINKHMDFFDPLKVEEDIHIIGCGAIGSHVALQLTRLGLTNIHLWDFDTVESINLANQNYFTKDINHQKVLSTANIMNAINPKAIMPGNVHSNGWSNQKMSGYIFLCLDNIDVRRAIVEAHKGSRYVKAIFDFRMGLTDAQHYAADWSDEKAKDRLLETMDFTHDEAKAITPVSACGTSLSVLPTIWAVVAAGIANFINFCNNELDEEPLIVGYKHTILVNPFASIVDAF